MYYNDGMAAPISIRLDDDIRSILETEASDHGVGLATYLRQLATEAARKARRERIRKQSEAVGLYVAGNAEARAFYEAWGTPSTDPS